MILSPGHADMKGKIFNFQRYAIHDGPGIRSVLFLSGCPLRCAWCCNPESFSEECGVHREAGAAEVLSWFLEDKHYFKNSGGGATFSGGEPLLQIGFLKQILEMCRQEGINTAIETCGEVSWENFAAISGLVDYYLYDIKHLDAHVHKEYTGVINERILNNLYKLKNNRDNIYLRIPLIPEFNMNENAITDIGRLAKDVSAAEVHLLPYHRFAEKKYAQLRIAGRRFNQKDMMVTPEGREFIEKLAGILRLYVQNVLIGG